MHIPIFNLNPYISAIETPDKWWKLSVEAAQLIATCYTAEQLADAPPTVRGNIRSNKTHPHHPAVKCIKSNGLFFTYTLRYGVFLIEEMMRRGVIAKAFHFEFLQWARENKPLHDFTGLWSHKDNIYKPKGYEHLYVTTAHQKYFNEHKQHLAQWTNAIVPKWYIQ